MKKITCPNCNFEGKPKYGRSVLIELVLFAFTWWMLLIPLFLYYGFTKRWICPKCNYKYVIKK